MLRFALRVKHDHPLRPALAYLLALPAGVLTRPRSSPPRAASAVVALRNPRCLASVSSARCALGLITVPGPCRPRSRAAMVARTPRGLRARRSAASAADRAAAPRRPCRRLFSAALATRFCAGVAFLAAFFLPDRFFACAIVEILHEVMPRVPARRRQGECVRRVGKELPPWH